MPHSKGKILAPPRRSYEAMLRNTTTKKFQDRVLLPYIEIAGRAHTPHTPHTPA